MVRWHDDVWVARYLTWLEHEAFRLGGGAIALHYLRCAAAAFAGYVASGEPRARYRAWLAIRTCAQWLAQLGGVAS